ncbi:MAG: NAD-dependent deacylase [Planctomycetes bacterium]|nr:NAD-dependent deacylase [Planctomycetota bacterium]
MIRLRDFRRIVFFTGAGLSAESGIPTYRGKGGIWAKYDYEEYACQRAFDRDPGKVWDFHDERRRRVALAGPNEGHRIIAATEGAVVVTQNIDGLHQRAGSKEVIELHGSLWRVRCARCRTVAENLETPIRSRRCACGSWLRPDIVWFEDMLDPATVRAAGDAISKCDLLVSIGTSGVVYPAADLPRLALARGAVTVEINPEDTPLSGLYTHRLRGGAAEMLGRLQAEGCGLQG